MDGTLRCIEIRSAAELLLAVVTFVMLVRFKMILQVLGKLSLTSEGCLAVGVLKCYYSDNSFDLRGPNAVELALNSRKRSHVATTVPHYMESRRLK